MNKFYLLVLCALLSACTPAFNRKTDYSTGFIPFAKMDMKGDQQCSVLIKDNRPYILNGDKKPSFTGIQRGGYGNPFNVHTKSGNSLEMDLSMLMRESYSQQLNVRCDHYQSDAKQYSKEIVYTLYEWKTDVMIKGRLLYDVEVSVASGGDVLSKHRVQGDQVFSKKDPLGNAITRALDIIHGSTEFISALAK